MKKLWFIQLFVLALLILDIFSARAQDTGSYLPSNCYTPADDICDWYERCLEKRLQNNDVTRGDLRAFNLRLYFCNNIKQQVSEFSAAAWDFVGRVGKCLQMEVAERFKREELSHEEVKDVAMRSHSKCHLDEGICTLSCNEWLPLIQTTDNAARKESFDMANQMISASRKCLPADVRRASHLRQCLSHHRTARSLWGRVKSAAWKGVKVGLKAGAKAAVNDLIRKRAVNKLDPDHVALEVGDQLAEQEGWDEKTINYLAFGDKVNSTVEVTMILTSQDLMEVGEGNSSAVVDKAIDKVMSDLKNGAASIRVTGLQPEKISECADLECNTSDETVYIHATSAAVVTGGQSGALVGSICLSLVFFLRL